MIKTRGSAHLYRSLLLANIVGLQLFRLWQSSADRRSETDSRVSLAALELLIEQKMTICAAIFIVLLCHYSLQIDIFDDIKRQCNLYQYQNAF